MEWSTPETMSSCYPVSATPIPTIPLFLARCPHSDKMQRHTFHPPLHHFSGIRVPIRQTPCAVRSLQPVNRGFGPPTLPAQARHGQEHVSREHVQFLP